jgi:hypothetical protein
VRQDAEDAEHERTEDDTVRQRKPAPKKDAERDEGDRRCTHDNCCREVVEEGVRVEEKPLARPQRRTRAPVLENSDETAGMGRRQHPPGDRRDNHEHPRPPTRTRRRVPGLEPNPASPRAEGCPGEHHDVECVQRGAERDRTGGLTARVGPPPAEDCQRHDRDAAREQEDTPRAAPVDGPQRRDGTGEQRRQGSCREPGLRHGERHEPRETIVELEEEEEDGGDARGRERPRRAGAQRAQVAPGGEEQEQRSRDLEHRQRCKLLEGGARRHRHRDERTREVRAGAAQLPSRPVPCHHGEDEQNHHEAARGPVTRPEGNEGGGLDYREHRPPEVQPRHRSHEVERIESPNRVREVGADGTVLRRIPSGQRFRRDGRRPQPGAGRDRKQADEKPDQQRSGW